MVPSTLSWIWLLDNWRQVLSSWVEDELWKYFVFALSLFLSETFEELQSNWQFFKRIVKIGLENVGYLKM